jgi:predicted O-methyltransferase YrrM
MSKVVKFFKGLILLIRKPYFINLILKEEGILAADFKKKFPNLTLQQIDLFAWPEAQEIQLELMAFLSGSSLPTDFALLQILCRKYQVENYFEIGTWRGESAANVAPFVKQVHTLNLSDEQLRNMGCEESYIKAHRTFSDKLSNVNHLFGDSAVFDLAAFEKKMDLIFIDGDHSKEGVRRDTQRMLQLRRNEQSVIVWHDAKSDTEYPRYDVLQGIFEGLPQQMHANVYLIKHSLCAVYLPEGPAGCAPVLHEEAQRIFKVKLTQQPFQA